MIETDFKQDTASLVAAERNAASLVATERNAASLVAAERNAADFDSKISNFHTHTFRCGHAQGDIADYANAAQEQGCVALGFSDHVPLPLDSIDNWQEIRMGVEQANDYIEKISKEKTNHDFPLYTGFECEWSKRYKNWYCDFIKSELKAEYLVLGSHWVEECGEFVYAANIITKHTLHAYIDATIEGMQSGLFAFLAHPDLFLSSFPVWNAETKACSTAIIDCANSLNLPLEINGEGMKKGMVETPNGLRYHYPFKEFWLLAKEKGAKIISNSDAHHAQDCLQQSHEARKLALEWGIQIENFDLGL